MSHYELITVVAVAVVRGRVAATRAFTSHDRGPGRGQRARAWCQGFVAGVDLFGGGARVYVLPGDEAAVLELSDHLQVEVERARLEAVQSR